MATYAEHPNEVTAEAEPPWGPIEDALAKNPTRWPTVG
jgi:hypothetical protein